MNGWNQRVNKVAVLSVPRLIGRKILHAVGDTETKLWLTNGGYACQRVQNTEVNKGRMKRQ